jgi:hypothetical protein
MKSKRKTITGEYSEHGYTVFVNGIPFYSAGNCVHDSAVKVAPGSPDAVPLHRLRTFCRRTCQEIAQESQAEFGGVERHSTRESQEAA